MSEPLADVALSHRNIAKRTHEMLGRMANTESLTGLLNQRGVVSMAERVLSNLKREKLSPQFTVTMLDMIGLKALNQKYTEDGANKLIKNSADAITATIRESDIAGRWGGDEFVIISFDTGSDGTETLIDKVKAAQPEEIKFNIVYKKFGDGVDVKSSIDDVYKNIEKVKSTLPKDKTGRSIGNGVVVQLSNV